ncbi:hypothetical protein SAMN02745866_00568 [Alteromonadaceae bacterium Bs31]|nr:hypothetical protein SAMN02745866_00568 [Alteromonadaceae bacterium Bs31]
MARVWDSVTVCGSAQYSQSINFDGLGRVSQTTTTFPGHNNSTTHYEKQTYDQFGRVFQVFDSARSSASFNKNGVKNVYNSQGYLERVVDVAGKNGKHDLFYQVKAMDARGKITEALYGNGVTQKYAYYQGTGLAKTIKAFGSNMIDNAQHIELVWDEVGEYIGHPSS